MAELFYQGHGSFRLVSDRGVVIYVDPYTGEGYDLPADIVLITHEHHDHNRLKIVPQKPECVVLRPENMLVNGNYQSRTVLGIEIKAVPAYNRNHDVNSCVGYLIKIDGKKVYAAGDTSRTDFMQDVLPKENLDYALLPMDGRYNMDMEEAAECAEIIGAKHTIPIHMKPGKLFDEDMAEAFKAKGKIIVKPNETIKL